VLIRFILEKANHLCLCGKQSLNSLVMWETKLKYGLHAVNLHSFQASAMAVDSSGVYALLAG
jgi:hypothetical protein